MGHMRDTDIFQKHNGHSARTSKTATTLMSVYDFQRKYGHDIDCHVLAHVVIHVLARVLLHMLVPFSTILARVVIHVLALVVLHVLAHLLLHVLAGART